MSMRPRHVLISTDALGGVWPYSLDLAAGLRTRGLSVTLALMGPAPAPAALAAAEAAIGARILVTGLPLDWTAPDAAAVRDAAAALAATARAVGADLVHLHSPALAVAAFGCPVIAVCHSCVATWWDACGSGPLPADLAWRRDLAAEGCGRANRLIAPTQAFARATRAAYGLAQPPEVVRNGRAMMDGGSHSPTPLGEGQEFFAGSAPGPQAGRDGIAGAPHAFAAGRLWDRAKNAETLDRMAARLDQPVRAAGPLDGPNAERAAFRHLRCLGRLDAAGIALELACRPVFVALARYEPFGLAVLEAAGAGCALVLSDIPSFRELWDGAARFVAPEDDAAAAGAVRDLLDNPGPRVALGEAARMRASAYGVDAMVEGVLGVMRAVARSPMRGGIAGPASGPGPGPRAVQPTTHRGEAAA
jgi:glycosyltransferase involved in cell wall biosynthesis